MSRQPSRNGVLALPHLRHDGYTISPRDTDQSYRSIVRFEGHTGNDQMSAGRAGSSQWQNEPQSREALQEHIRTITDIVLKLGRDIQTLEAQIKERDGETVGTQHVVKNLEVHHILGVTDLRARVVRCDASIARLSSDIKSAFESIQSIALRQQEQHAKITEKLHQLDTRMRDLTNALERIHSEHLMKLQHIESGAVQQFTGLDSKTRSMADDVKTALHTVRVAEQGERDKLETRLLAQMERMLSQRDLKQEKAEHRKDEMMAELNRNITRLQDEILKEREKTMSLHQSLESRFTGPGEMSLRQYNDELVKVKRELRVGFDTVRDSIDEVKEVVEARRRLMEEQIRKELSQLYKDVSQIRKMAVLL